MDLSSVYAFQADLDSFARALDVTMDKLREHVALDVFQLIVQGNPVDTGHSRANWRIALGEPDSTVTPGGSGVPSPQVTNFAGDEDIFITNAVDYVRWLEEGSSKQAPSGFIRIALAQAEAKVDSYVRQARDLGFR